MHVYSLKNKNNMNTHKSIFRLRIHFLCPSSVILPLPYFQSKRLDFCVYQPLSYPSHLPHLCTLTCLLLRSYKAKTSLSEPQPPFEDYQSKIVLYDQMSSADLGGKDRGVSRNPSASWLHWPSVVNNLGHSALWPW